MGSKNKLKRFRENETFPNVIQPTREEVIHHFSYKSFKEHVLKVQSYKELQAIELFKKGKKATILQIIIKPKSRFFIHYILRLGFLDGLVGFIIALTQSYGIFIKYKDDECTLDSVLLSDFKAEGKVLLVMGNEANGIHADNQKILDQSITIAQAKSSTAESLNVGTATAILLGHLSHL